MNNSYLDEAVCEALPDPSTSQVNAVLFVPSASDPPVAVELIVAVSFN